jgi:NADH:ubiquinone oxidoreductase subunit 5 (subunit L)/multisubunit Na+/H+ antiporter MnhA subunit
VIRLGLRMAVAGGRATIARLAIIGVAVAIGVGLVLSALAGMTAAQRQNAHYDWLNSAHAEAATGPSAADPASLVIAGCSLAVSITGGLNEHRQPFAMLRLAGLGLSELRRVVLLESAVPLLAVSLVAIVAGFLSAALFLKSQLDYVLHAPGAGYYVITVAGLVVSLALIASTMPLLRRLTGPETVRND